MAELNWGLLPQPDIAGDAYQAYVRGQKQGQDQIGQNAMMALVQDPKNTQAMGALSAVAPTQALAFQQNERATAAATREATTADQAAKRENYLLAAKLTRNIKTPEEWDAAKQSPELQQLVPDVVSKTWEQFQSFHQVVSGLDAPKKYEAANLGGGAFGRFDPEAGTLTELRARDPDAPKGDWKERTKADGSTEFVWLGAPGSKPPGVGAPAAPQDNAPPPAGTDTPRGLRNNNPLNIRPLAHGQWDGQTGVDQGPGGGYAQFGSEQDGWNAAHKNLQSYGKNHGINTVAAVINRWAPGSDGNNPGAYAATVAKALGVAPDAPIDLADAATREKLLTAMSGVELGRPYAGPAPQAAAAPAPTGPPVVPGSAPKPKGHVSTPEEVKAAGLPEGTAAFTNPATGKAEPYSGEFQPYEGLSPDAIQQQAEAYLAGGKLPTGMGRTAAKDRQAIMNLAAKMQVAAGKSGVDALVAAAGFRSSSAALTKVTNQASMIDSFEQAARANGEILRSVLTKGAGPSSPLFNRPIQVVRSQLGDADVSALETAMQTYVGEVAKINSGNTGSAGATDSMRKEMAHLIDPNASPKQILASMDILDRDMANRTKSLHDQIETQRSSLYTGGVQQPKDTAAPGAAKGAGGSPPASALKDGVQTTFGNGQVWTLRSGKPARIR